MRAGMFTVFCHEGDKKMSKTSKLQLVLVVLLASNCMAYDRQQLPGSLIQDIYETIFLHWLELDPNGAGDLNGDGICNYIDFYRLLLWWEIKIVIYTDFLEWVDCYGEDRLCWWVDIWHREF